MARTRTARPSQSNHSPRSYPRGAKAQPSSDWMLALLNGTMLR